MREENEEGQLVSWKVLALRDTLSSDPKNVYLIDHAWTFRPRSARQQLQSHPGLLSRMAALMDIPTAEGDEKRMLAKVMSLKWKFSGTYALGNPDIEVEDKMPVWYVMDEFGSRIQHSDEPNVRTVPFISVTPQGPMTFSLLFLLRDLKEGQEIFR